MSSEEPYMPPAGVAEMFGWVTVGHFLLIAFLAAGAIALLWWGRHLRRRRKQIRAEQEQSAREAHEREAED